MQQTLERNFRGIFSVEGEYQTENDDEPVGLVNTEMSVLLMYEDKEKFGLVDVSTLAESPESFNYSVDTDEASLWAMKGRDSTYYYQDDYIKKVAEFFGVTPPELEEYAKSNFEYSEYPALFEKDGVRILVAPYFLS